MEWGSFDLHSRVAILDIKKIDFSKIGDEIIHVNLDDKKEEDMKDIMPKL